MPEQVTLQQVEELASRLTVPEQLGLIARLSQRLSRRVPVPADDAARQRQSNLTHAEEFMRMAEELAPEPRGEVDSAAEIRTTREERASRL